MTYKDNIIEGECYARVAFGDMDDYEDCIKALDYMHKQGFRPTTTITEDDLDSSVVFLKAGVTQ